MKRFSEYIYLIISDKIDSWFAKVVKVFLLALSFIYGLALKIISSTSRKSKLGLPAIGVGNITWGGTGKTPFVVYLAKVLKNSGRNPAILTRGYAKSKDTQLADEAEVFKGALGDIPVIVGKNRIRSAKIAQKKYKIDSFILDDAFQQWKIRKDLEIVLINANNPFGNGKLIPRGILREPLSSLKRAVVLVFNKIDNPTKDFPEMKSILKELNPNALFVEANYVAVDLIDAKNNNAALASLKGKKVLLISAIADPQYFEKMAKVLGADVVGHIGFRDHHNYSAKDINSILEGIPTDMILVTEKDLVKLRQFSDKFDKRQIKLFALRIDFKVVTSEQELLNKINAIFEH